VVAAIVKGGSQGQRQSELQDYVTESEGSGRDAMKEREGVCTEDGGRDMYTQQEISIYNRREE